MNNKENKHYTCTVPEATPQQGGIHQADENKLAKTSGGNKVTRRCTWSKLRTRAKRTPTTKRTTARIHRDCCERRRTLSEIIRTDSVGERLKLWRFLCDVSISKYLLLSVSWLILSVGFLELSSGWSGVTWDKRGRCHTAAKINRPLQDGQIRVST